MNHAYFPSRNVSMRLAHLMTTCMGARHVLIRMLGLWLVIGAMGSIGYAVTSVTLTANPASPGTVNTNIVLTATPTGGTNVQYKFFVKVGRSTSSTVLQDYSATNTCTWSTATGDYYVFTVWAREVGSGNNYDCVKAIGYYVSTTPLSSPTLTAAPVSGQSWPNHPITLTAGHSNGTGTIENRFFKQAPGEGTQTTIQAYSQTNTCTWTPTVTGTHTFLVWEREVGSVNSWDVYTTISFEVVADPAPVAVDDTDTTDEDVAKTVSVLTNDSDAAGDALTVTAVTDPPHGTAVINSGTTITYTPDGEWHGTDSFTYTLTDAHNGTDTATVTMTVNAKNDAPSFTFMANADQTVLEDASLQTVSNFIASTDMGPNDEDATQAVSDYLVTNNNNALFTTQPDISNAGTLTFRPYGNRNGSATVTVQLKDNGGTAHEGVDTSAPQTFTITVTAVNDVPMFTKGADQAVLEDCGPQTVTGWATAISPGYNEPGQVLDFIVTNDNAALFSTPPALSPTGALTYTPAANANGVATVTVQLHDNGGTENGGVDTSASQTFTLTVTAVNDAPDAVNDSRPSFNNSPVTATVLNNDSDVDGNPLTIFAVTQGTHGSVTINGTNTAVTYTVTTPDYVGNDTFTYTVIDGLGGMDTATVSIQVYAPPSGNIAVASCATDGTLGQGNSLGSSISGDGRYVVYCSDAENLVASDTNNASDIFLRDTQTGELATTRISTSSTGTQGNADSWDAVISSDGAYIAFASWAENLVVGDNNDASDIFLYHRPTGNITCISVAENATQANGNCWAPSISGDGQYVTFVSDATNLVDEDEDDVYDDDTNERSDVFVYDRTTGSITRVSMANNGAQGNGNSDTPVISADGAYVAFVSDATALIPGDTNLCKDVFLTAWQTLSISRISVSTTGGQGDAASWGPSISADGSYITFVSDATNLTPNDTNGAADVFLRTRQSANTALVSMSNTLQQGNDISWEAAISGNGRYVAFVSDATQITDSDTNDRCDAFRYDRQLDLVTRLSLPVGIGQGNGNSWDLSINTDGTRLAFRAVADNIAAADDNDHTDILLWKNNIP